tara:strand:+ start:462 stop:791 length:330 start_codon:yes stop_codon:yes gene_type:complete
MEINGKLIKVLDAEAGTSKSGKPWQRQSIVVETDNEFNNQVCISAFGEDKINNMNKLSVGDNVTILCNVYSREYKGKYYHNIDGYWFSKQGEGSKATDFVTTDDNEMPF